MNPRCFRFGLCHVPYSVKRTRGPTLLLKDGLRKYSLLTFVGLQARALFLKWTIAVQTVLIFITPEVKFKLFLSLLTVLVYIR